MEWIEKANEDIRPHNQVLSFGDYMEHFTKNALKESRPTFSYLLDMIKHFGKTEGGRFNLFLKEEPDCPAVFGQFKPQQALYENLINFSEEGINNKFILLVGPNGSSKSSLVKKIMKGAELYSETDEGSLYSFSWVFPNDVYLKGAMGLSSTNKPQDAESFANLDDKSISAILPSELKDHPLLLIPLSYRQKLIDKYLIDTPKKLESVQKSYLYRGDLSKRNRMIYDALLKSYKGDHKEVLKHIKVERFTLSRRYSTGAVTIEPQIHVDARIQQITMDKRLQSLPPSLQSLNLFSMQGEVVLANRGILEYSDLLKRPLDAFKYLLMTMETGTINLNGILTELDIFFIGTSNEIHLAGFKQHPDYNSFKGRFNFIRVPYLLNFLEEEKIYYNQIKGLRLKTFFEPYSLRILCLFAVMTRLRSCQSKNYSDKNLSTIAANLNPMEKALLLTEDPKFPNLDSESQQILENGLEFLRDEFRYENLYEGKFGLSPRDIKKIIYKLTAKHKNVTFMDVLDYLEKMIQEKNEFDFLNMTPQGDYHNPIRFISLLREYSLDLFDRELRDSLGLIDERSYEEHIKKYITNINAMIKGEKVHNKITDKYEDYNDYFIKEFETSIGLTEKPQKFRSYLISKLGAFALDNPGKDIIYGEVFPDVIHKLQESFRNEQKKYIQNVSKNLVFFEAEKDDSLPSSLSEKDKGQISHIFENLIQNFGHSQKGAASTLKYIIKERY
jgi:predicted Ser/Thr protein kinase